MPKNKFRILSTRPLAQELIRKAAEHDILISEQAFIDIRPVTTPEIVQQIMNLAAKGGTIVFSSPNAVKIMTKILPYDWNAEPADDRRVYCLQGATKLAVEEHMSRTRIAGTAASSKELAERIIADRNTSTVTFICGNIRRNELPNLLREQHIAVEEIVVYETVETPAALKGTYDGLLFLSPSSARSFFSSNTPAAHTVCFAIGQTTAAALGELTGNRVITSPEPSVELLVQTAIFYFDNINC